MATFNLSVVTPEREIFSAAVDSLQAPGMEGSFGVLANHAPMVAALLPGLVRITDADGRELRLFVGGGFFQVSNNTAQLLADSAEFASDINAERAKSAEERALGRLSGKFEGEVMQRERAEGALQRARARTRVAAGR
ncbi:ATP synthase F1 subcomplex epsilon subunit [Abditibacterium utsteinense]|uniref:ATP synthase epsilon chain n=1 Tax=Abditibacterium utsteinense TaxID=1960156 RepID=A0A2S8SV88_9BACT|nr:ATP synthase F1 subunit epsilon [Abditibacterium utsteinense]PQV64717.1 ATP synthase F1 subcomplex epsilon subunit [Abditibacterium utsteinense]